MKKLIIILGISLISIITNAQITVITDDSTYTPTSVNAIFELHTENHNKGILIPRLSTTERQSIVTSGGIDQSLLVFDTNTKTFWFFDDTNWVEMATGGTVSDDQNLTGAVLTGTNLEISIEDGTAVNVDLSSLQDGIGTDSQTISYDNVTGNLSITGGNTITLPVTSGGDNWGSQTVETDATLNGDGSSSTPLTVNGVLTDDQNLTLSSNSLSIEDGNAVDLAPYLDNTDQQNISGSGLSGTILTIGIENGTNETVDLSSLQDGTGTDDQNLTLSSNSLSIEGGNAVDLAPYLDNTDQQNISGSGLSGTTLTIGIENGTNETVDLSILQDGTGTDDQNLTLSSNSLSIEDGNAVDLAPYLDNTDQQNITGSGLSGTILTIGIENGTNETVDFQPLLDDFAWQRTGNAGTVPGVNFMGTTDNQEIEFRTNNIKKATLTTKGQLEFYNTGYSIFIGNHAGEEDDLSSNNNVFVGFYSGQLNTTGNENIALGSRSLYNNTTGSKNSALGRGALYSNTTGNDNIALGTGAMYFNTTGTDNIAIGRLSLEQNTTGKWNTATGSRALMFSTTANGNTANGYSALKTNTTGAENTAIGNNALFDNTTGAHNTAIGSYALANNTTASSNTANGYSALKTNTTGTDNTAVGNQALNFNSDGNNNSAVGSYSGYNITTGDENTFIGQRVGYYMQEGNSNTAVGYQAFYNFGGAGSGTHAGGNGNTAIGKYAMFNPTSGDYNVAVGYTSYSLNNSGSQNVFVGYASDASGDNTASYAVALGANSSAGASNIVAIGSSASADALNATAIGYRAHADQANTLILGQINGINGSTNDTKVGVGTNNPTSRLEVKGDIRITDDANAMLILGRVDNSGEGGQINYTGSNGNSGWVTDVAGSQFRIYSQIASTTTVRMFNNDGSGTTNLEIDGQAYKPGGGSWAVSSDRRSKENIVDYHKGLNELLALRPVNFNYKKEFNWGVKTYTGLIAQEVEEIVPTMVLTRETNNIKDFKVIDPNELTYMLINAVKELKAENETLKQELEKKNAEILERLEKLEQK